MFNPQGFAENVKRVLARRDTVIRDRVLLLARETVSELAADVGKQFDDVDRTGIFYHDQEVGAAAVRLVGIDFHEHPARGAIDSNE